MFSPCLFQRLRRRKERGYAENKVAMRKNNNYHGTEVTLMEE